MYTVIQQNDLEGTGRDHYTSVFVTDDPVKAEYNAKRRAAKNFGTSEYVIFKQIGITKTAMPSEVTVTVNS